MALGFDPSILLSARGINLPDPMALAQRQMTLGALADQRRVREEQAAAQARAAAEAEALRAALPAVVRGGFSDEAIAGADPRAIPALLQQADKYRKTKAETAKDEAEAESKRSGTKLKVAEHLANEAMWLADHPNLSPDMIANFQKKVATVGAQDVLTNVPFQDWANPERAREALRSTGNMFYTIKDRVAQAETGRHNLATEGNTRRGQDLTRQTATEGHQVTIRGQNVSAETARRGQDLVNARAIDSNAAARDAAAGAKVNSETQALAKFVESNALPNLITSASALDATLAKYGKGDIPGVGPIDSRVPTLLQSTEGKAVRAQIQAVSNDLLKLYSGGAVTLNEAERRTVEMMAAGDFSDDDLRNAWPLIKGRINAAVQNVRGGFSPQAIETYEGRGGMRLGPVGGAQQPSSSAPAVGQSFQSMPDPKSLPVGAVVRAPDGARYRNTGQGWATVR